MMKMECGKYESPMGPLWLTGEKGILTGLSFERPHGEVTPGEFPAVKRWLDAYFRGIPQEIDFPMAPSGTPFQKRIWDLLLEIPFGQTRTYGDLAREMAQILGKEKMSAQAVGQAVGRNPIAIIIPCHRIIGAKGKLTGYAFGNEKKQWLLNHEESGRERYALRRLQTD